MKINNNHESMKQNRIQQAREIQNKLRNVSSMDQPQLEPYPPQILERKYINADVYYKND